jgi:hypothetical protein
MMKIDAMGNERKQTHKYYLTSAVHSYNISKEHSCEETEKMHSQMWQQIHNNGSI